MPDLKITELPTSTVADNDDIITFVDVSQVDPALKNRKITTENYLAGRLKIKKLPITGNYTIPADIFDDGTDIVVYNVSGAGGTVIVTIDSAFNDYNRLKGFEIRITADARNYEVRFTGWSSVTGSYTSDFAAGPAYPTILVLAGYSVVPRIVNYNAKTYDDIRTNTANIATNTANIATNTGNISTNTTNIATNVTNISTNATNIAQNVLDIEANTIDIEAALKENVIDFSYNEIILDAAKGTVQEQGATTVGPTSKILRVSATIDGIDTFEYKLNNNTSTDQVAIAIAQSAQNWQDIYDYGCTFKLSNFRLDLTKGALGCSIKLKIVSADIPPASGITGSGRYEAVLQHTNGILTVNGISTGISAFDRMSFELRIPAGMLEAEIFIDGFDTGIREPFALAGVNKTETVWSSNGNAFDKISYCTKIGFTFPTESRTKQLTVEDFDGFNSVKFITPNVRDDFDFILPANMPGTEVGRTLSVVANNEGGDISITNTDNPPTFFVIRDGITVPDQNFTVTRQGVIELLNIVENENTYNILSNNVTDINEGSPQYTYNHTLTAFINVTLPLTGSEYILNFKDPTGTGMFVDGETSATTQEPTPLNPYLEVVNGTDLLVLRDVPKGFVALLELRLNKIGGVASQISVFIRTSSDGITYVDRPDSLRTTVVSNDGDVTFGAGLTDLAGFSAGTYIRIGLQNSGAGTLTVTTPPPITTSLGTVNGYAVKFSLQLDV